MDIIFFVPYLGVWIWVLYRRHKHKNMLRDLELNPPDKTFIQKTLGLKSDEQKEIEKALLDDVLIMIGLIILPFFLTFILFRFSSPGFMILFDLIGF